MSSTRSGVLVVAALACCGAFGEGPAAQDAQPRFRAGVEGIEVAVLARDNRGRLVTDLTASEVTVREDGVAQQIVAFDRISLPAVVRRAAVTGPTNLAAARDVSSTESLADARVFVLVLDALHIAPDRNLPVRAHAKRFVEEFVGPDDLVAVLAPGAVPEASEDFTTDRARLLAAIDKFTGTKLKSYTQQVTDAFGVGQRIKEGMGSDSERAYRVLSLSSSLESVAGHLDRIGGRRKALLLFSEGVDYDTGDVMGKYQRYASEVTLALSRAVGAVMRTNTVLYSIDPRGLGTAQGDLLADPIHQAEPGNPESLSETDFHREFERSIWSLRDLARATGGFLATDKGLTRAFEQIVEESSDYYMLRYVPAKPGRPGESRRIEVRVSRPGVTAVARRGYTVPRPEIRRDTLAPEPELHLPQRGMPRARTPPGAPTPAASRVRGVPAQLEALLASPLPAGGLPLRVHAVPFRAGEKKGEIQIIIEVLGRGLQFAGRDGEAEERLELALITVDARGRGANGRSTTIDLRLPPGEVERVRATGVRWLSKLDLDPGRYQLRVAARADRTGTTGLVTHMVDVPRFGAGDVSMSGVTLTSRSAVVMPTRGKGWLDGELGTPPSAARTFVVGDRVTAAVEVYAPASVQPALEVAGEILTAAGTRVLTLDAQGAPGSSAAGVTTVAFAAETSELSPGGYVLRIAARGGTGSPIERRVPFEIVPQGEDAR